MIYNIRVKYIGKVTYAKVIDDIYIYIYILHLVQTIAFKIYLLR